MTTPVVAVSVTVLAVSVVIAKLSGAKRQLSEPNKLQKSFSTCIDSMTQEAPGCCQFARKLRMWSCVERLTEDLRAKDEEIRVRDEQLRVKDAELVIKDEQIMAKDSHIKLLTQALLADKESLPDKECLQ